MKIGIAYSTHNRRELATKSIEQAKKLAPKGSIFVICDDGSEIPYPNANYRNEKAQGIASIKNKCIELLYDAGCTHFFLFDDDTFPLAKDWHLPYVNSGINHLSMTFDKFRDGKKTDRRLIRTVKGISEFASPCGCALYFTRECFDKVGGMDWGFGAWGWEHVSLSMRIHNAGLTHKPFLDVTNSHELIYCADWDNTIQTVRSVPGPERQRLAALNRTKYLRELKSSAYIPFKEQKGVVLTTYLTGCVDPQRGQKWEADIEQVRTLAESVKRNGTKLVLINDCFSQAETDDLGVISRLPWASHDNPYFLRWKAYREYLKTHEHDNVWLVDATDCELLRHPFRNIQPGKIYVGWEKEFIGCQWMLNHHKSNFSQTFIRCNIKTPLLNAGVIGGRYDMVMEFLDRICDMIGILPELHSEDTDMATFNWVLYSHFNGRFVADGSVTTEFKAFKDNGKAIWRHK